jgi:hypothetical protein
MVSGSVNPSHYGINSWMRQYFIWQVVTWASTTLVVSDDNLCWINSNHVQNNPCDERHNHWSALLWWKWQRSNVSENVVNINFPSFWRHVLRTPEEALVPAACIPPSNFPVVQLLSTEKFFKKEDRTKTSTCVASHVCVLFIWGHTESVVMSIGQEVPMSRGQYSLGIHQYQPRDVRNSSTLLLTPVKELHAG